MIIEATCSGATIDEAKEKAIAELNAAEDADIQFQVITTPKKKTLGLFGGRLAEVRVFVEVADKPTEKKHEKRNVRNNRTEKRAGAAPEKKTETAKTAEKPEKSQAEQKKESTHDFGETVDVSLLAPDSKAAKAVAYLKVILEKLGCTEITMKAAEKDNRLLIELDGEGLGAVIGHRGETLDSVQYLTSLAASNNGGYYKVTLNIGNYRQKREEALVSLANRVAAQVLKTGKSRSLEPMNPYERRVIHTAVQSIDGVVSSSYGEGSSRRVFIAVEGGDMRPPRREYTRHDSRSNNRRGGYAAKATPTPTAREPKRDSDMPLYGKIN